jgi:hypothetical protein
MQCWWGNFELRQHNILKARQYYESSLSLYKEIGPRNTGIVSVHFKLAFVLWKLDEHEQALYDLDPFLQKRDCFADSFLDMN